MLTQVYTHGQTFAQLYKHLQLLSKSKAKPSIAKAKQSKAKQIKA